MHLSVDASIMQITDMDLSNSFLHMRPTSSQQTKRAINTWITNISSVLHLGDKTAYLGSPCRSENVNARRLISGWAVEKQQVKAWDADYIMKSGSPIYHPIRGEIDRIQNAADQHIEFDLIRSEANFVPLSLVTAATSISNGKWAYTQMKVTFDGGAIVCPVRYINAPISGAWYTQPITGPVLWYNDQRFRVGFLVCCTNEQGETRAEIVVRAPTNPFREKAKRSGRAVKVLMGIFDATIGSFAANDDFVEVVELINPKLTFFRKV